MGAPRGNKNAAGHHNMSGMRRAYNRLTPIDKTEIRYYRRGGGSATGNLSLRTLESALRSSKPKLAAPKRRKVAMLGYIKQIKKFR